MWLSKQQLRQFRLGDGRDKTGERWKREKINRERGDRRRK
jgi:hypothetical protein